MENKPKFKIGQKVKSVYWDWSKYLFIIISIKLCWIWNWYYDASHYWFDEEFIEECTIEEISDYFM